MVKTNWSGNSTCLYYGEWTLEVNGIDVTDKIPEYLREKPMNTYRTYQSWYFDEEYSEVFEDYTDGLKIDDWIAENKEWLDKISTDINIQREIFNAINEQDFRPGSCGGCI